MNRFNQGKRSKMQCEMILAFLSFADYFRPRFFLLENVRNFVTFNKGQTFRLTLASLLEMGYQVHRFLTDSSLIHGYISSSLRLYWPLHLGYLIVFLSNQQSLDLVEKGLVSLWFSDSQPIGKAN